MLLLHCPQALVLLSQKRTGGQLIILRLYLLVGYVSCGVQGHAHQGIVIKWELEFRNLQMACCHYWNVALIKLLLTVIIL
jgi:hypothetical protein